MKKFIFLIFLFLVFCRPPSAFGAAASPQAGKTRMKQQKMMQQKMMQQRQMMQQKMLQQRQMMEEQGQPPRPSAQTQVQDIVEIQELWDAFETSSEAWSLMIDLQPKEITVARYIEIYRRQGVIIRKPASHYVNLIDGMSHDSPEMLRQPFANIMRFVAIIEYDFDNGQDKDTMALKVLGQKNFLQNKRRLGLR